MERASTRRPVFVALRTSPPVAVTGGAQTAARIAGFTAVAILVLACGGTPRPDRIVAPDLAGLIVDVDRPGANRETIVLEGNRSVEIDTERALDLAGPGPSADRVLLYGQSGGRVWFATAATAQTMGPPGCYLVHGDAAFDTAESVLVVFTTWRDTAIEIRKRADFNAPPEIVRADGRYEGGESPSASICVDASGLAFGLP